MIRPASGIGDWERYLARFHAARPGITEEILVGTTSEVGNPYQWLLQPVPPEASVLDVACGSAPLRRYDRREAWVGVDRSRAELHRARSKPASAVVLGDVSRLPFPDGSFDAVTCAMAAMLFDPLGDCLGEMTRVLAPGATIEMLLPGGSAPLVPSDLRRWAHLLTALRVLRLRYPNDRSMRRRLAATIQRHRLQVMADERRRFSLQVTSPELADRFVDSLYLPEAPRRTASARRVARSWVGAEIGIPLRRVRLRPVPSGGAG